MKVLLICPPTETPCPNQREYPLGLLYLETCLHQEKHETLVKNYYSEHTYEQAKEDILNIISSFKPDVVGFNCMTMNRTSCFKLTRIIKQFPNIKVIMGGVHASSMYEQILLNIPVDVIVLGEGEQTICDLTDAFERDLPLKDIKGIAFKDNNKVIVTTPRLRNCELDLIPFPRHDIFKEQIEKTKCARMMTSRGCPFGCTYCSTSAYWGRMWRPRSAKNVVEEIEYILKILPCVEEIFFYDDTFTVDNQRVIDMCELIIKKRIKLRLKCSARVDRVSREMLVKMKEAGFADIAYGIESGSAKMLESMHKCITKEQIKAAVDLTNDVGLIWHGFMLVGCPGETWSTINESIEFAKTLKNFDIDAVSPLEIYPNTEVYHMAKEKGFDENFWLTEQPVPHYTYEHSDEELSKMAFTIVYKNKINQGLFKFLSFSFKYFRKKPGKTIRFILSLIKGKIFKG